MADYTYPKITGNPQPLAIPPQYAAAFTGRRALDEAAPNANAASAKTLEALLFRQYEAGYRVFFTGMATGFDLFAARAALNLRGALQKDVFVVGVIPFAGQTRGWSARWAAEYEAVRRLLDCAVTLRKSYSPQAYFFRNKFMVDHSSLLIAQTDASGGGTAQTIRLARASGIEIVFAEEEKVTETDL